MEDKRQNIIEKAFELYHQYGIKSVSMDDIARNMGISKKTLYQYISDKNELVECVFQYSKAYIEDVFSAFKRDDLNAIEQNFELSDNIRKKNQRFKPTFLYDMKKYYPALLRELKDIKFKIIYESNLANLKKGKEEGFYMEDINEHIIARIMVSYHLFTFDPGNGLFTDTEVMDMGIFEEVYKYHFRGICTPKGIEELNRLFCKNNNQ
ncbi:TetR/AcrR family transcriptional regulator [Carboxylicivirga caseinilyticus]|uniref:TetR/AcrR family transcriptional regulator n=1 Tax=Carboxylicivirga caseinilyticus TaxID=3417572 RepID=UPI003D328072|nr:TetR/AcrR family transcriptional regulator [Marinilabiliaceae bacterium A049]